MSASPHDPLLPALAAEVQAELELVDTSGPANVTAEPLSEWQFDPADVEREEVGLQSLLGAVGALEGRPGNDPDGSR